jgi:hypothetical protein
MRAFAHAVAFPYFGHQPEGNHPFMDRALSIFALLVPQSKSCLASPQLEPSSKYTEKESRKDKKAKEVARDDCRSGWLSRA